ncbi:MAG: hypothetical protein AAFR47_22740 [Pseudomonadota bacterium]
MPKPPLGRRTIISIFLGFAAVSGLVVWVLELPGFRAAQKAGVAKRLEYEWCRRNGDLWENRAKLCRGLYDGEVKTMPQRAQKRD